MSSGTATKLVLSGVHSADDARQVEAVLATLPGVYAARVDPAARVAVVRHESAVTIAQLIRAVEEAGYRARRAVAGESSTAYASSPWGALRPEGRTPAAEVALTRTLALVGLLLIAGQLLAEPWLTWKEHQVFAKFILGTVAQAILGARFYAGAWRALARRRVGTDFLVAAATTAGYLYSAFSAFGSDPGRLHFLTATLILTAVTAGRWLELWLSLRAGLALRALVELAPLSARVLHDGEETEVLSCDLLAGDLVVVRSGERFPADGTVVEGSSAADESMLTGEALPRPKLPGSPVLGGTINGHGRLVFRADRVADQTALARMVELVHVAGRTRPLLARVAERLACLVGPGAVLVALGAWAGTCWLAEGPAAEQALVRVMAVLAAACPWALLGATPAALSAALGRAARLGILIRSGPILEACARLRAVAFDKTGTLTLGRPELRRLVAAEGVAGTEVLGIAAALAAGADHPLDRAIADIARDRGAEPREVTEVSRVAGAGIRGLLAGEPVLLGSRALVAEEAVDLGALDGPAGEMEAAGHTVLFLASGGKVRGLLAFVDPLKPGAAHTVDRICRMGLAPYLISGDGSAAAGAVAARAGIPGENVSAEARPEDRPSRIRAIRERRGAVAMVGDGVRDGPALREAEVGMAIGCGADVDIESADVVLVGEDLRGVLRALRIARRAAAAMRLNLAWALLFNAAALPVAALGLLSPAYAAMLMVLASLLVAANSCQLSLRPAGLLRRLWS